MMGWISVIGIMLRVAFVARDLYNASGIVYTLDLPTFGCDLA